MKEGITHFIILIQLLSRGCHGSIGPGFPESVAPLHF